MAEENGNIEVFRTNIYVVKSDHLLFQKICEREGKNVSEKFREFEKQYNQAHRPGNPQLMISSYAKPEEAQPMRVKCLFIQGAMTNGLVLCRLSGLWQPGVKCYSCPKNDLRKERKL